jgi:hypothetical protein
MAATLALVFAAGGATATAAGPPARCAFTSGSHLLHVEIMRDRRAPGRTGVAYLGVRGRSVHLFAGGSGNAVSCAGPSPTTRNVETVQVTASPRLASTELYVDQRRGAFTPGYTNEGDGSSEIEFDISLGARGSAYFLMTPGDDAVYARDLGTATIASLNAFEAPFDFDVALRAGGLILFGVGGDDLMSAAPPDPGPNGQYPTSEPRSGFGIGLLGGAGSDGLFGTPASDALVGGRGADLVIAGAGFDAVSTSDRAVDHVNCGPGFDRLTSDRRDRTAECERGGGGAAAARATRLPLGDPLDQLPLRLRRR